MDASEYTVERYRDSNEYSIQRILDSRRELSKSVSMILAELEIVAIGNNSGNNDVAVLHDVKQTERRLRPLSWKFK